MLLDTSYKKLQEIYSTHLNEIREIKFTFKEVHIIACLLHNRGYKKIASLLSISPKTVESHIHNIMLKLGYRSRESIIDLVEKSGKMHLIKQFYLHLLVQASFYNQLQTIGKVLNREGCICLLHRVGINKQQEILLKQLQVHLKVANITLINIEDSDQNTKEAMYNIYVSSKELVDNHQLPEGIFIVLDKNLEPDEINHIKGIDFRKEENYYLSLLELLKHILNKTNLDRIIQEFTTECTAILNNGEEKNIRSKSYYRNFLITFILQLFKEKPSSKKLIIILVCFSFFILFISWIIIQRNIITNRTADQQDVRASFSLPHESTRLERSAIIAEINSKLKYQGDIKTVALIGIGGAGKTTVARQYAREQKANIVWEINAETEESLIASFEQLSYAASQTQEERNELREIQETKNPDKSRKKLMLLVRKQLKSHSPWFLVYDNVENFLDIQDYFPQDSNAWGSGRVILTTRNNSIANNSYYIGNNKGVFFGELEASEQFMLFTKILDAHPEAPYTILQKEKIQQFLQHIPPFPLDVSTAASYIKETGISYEEYLKRIDCSSEEFAFTQTEMTKENNTYNKNRYGIITLSLKHIIDQHPDFADLLLFISLMDSQEIPRDLLDLYKGKIVVDNFLHNLQRYSMIIGKDSKYK